MEFKLNGWTIEVSFRRNLHGMYVYTMDYGMTLHTLKSDTKKTTIQLKNWLKGRI